MSKQEKSEGKKKPEKIILDTQPPRSGSCVFHNVFYAVSGILLSLYVAFVLDKESFGEYSARVAGLEYVHQLFHVVDKYSPFHEFLESDEEFMEKFAAPQQEKPEAEKGAGSSSGVRVFTTAELAKYDGSPDSPGTYLAILGQVFDVSKGSAYYGPGGGYAFFSGKDGSRAYVTGQFDEAGLVDDVTGLEKSNYLGLKDWVDFYGKDYTKVGVLEGRFYNSKGEVTEYWKQLQGWIEEAQAEADKQDAEKQMFPPCNVEWTKEKGSRYWCTNKSGGVARDWVGVPRRLFYPGREERCACVKASGAPTTDPGAKSNRGDLDNPHLKEYQGCKADNFQCWNK